MTGRTPLHSLVRMLLRLLAAAAIAGSWVTPAHADIAVTFHSFNGSVVWGRYPHTFVAFDGTLENGERVRENYGFSARSATPDILAGPVRHMMMSEKERYLTSTNRHFTIRVPDDVYRKMKAEVIAWRDAPGKFYDLETRNCIHFVGRMAELAGLTVEYPSSMLRKPKAWLNHITGLNPQLGARAIR